MAVKPSHWLRWVSQSMNVTSNVTGMNATFTNGDYDGNNVIDAFDILGVESVLGMEPYTIPIVNATADLNGDGVVDVNDLAIVRNNYGQFGDSVMKKARGPDKMRKVYSLGVILIVATLMIAGSCNAAITFWLSTYGSTLMITSGTTVSVPTNTPITMSAWYRSGSNIPGLIVNLMIGYGNTTGYGCNAVQSGQSVLSSPAVTFVSGFTPYPVLTGGAASPVAGSRPYGFFQAGEWASSLSTLKQKLSDFTLNSTLSYGQSVTLTIWGVDSAGTYGTDNIWTSCLVDSAGNVYRPSGNYYITLTGLPGPPNAVKQQVDTTYTSVTGIVTAVFDGFFYIEDSQRISGMLIDGSASVGDVVTASGTMATSSGERVLENTAVSVTSAGGTRAGPLGLTNMALGGAGVGPVQGVDGGAGLNNLGLLVTTTGAITSVDTVSIPGSTGTDHR